MKVVVITGASRGLGKEIAKLYLEKEYTLILNDINEESFKDFAGDSKVNIIAGNIGNDNVRSQIADKVRELGRIDILINNAGITFIQPFEENTEEQFDKLLEVDLKAPILLTQKIYPFMVAQKHGTVININSTAGKEPRFHHTMYNAVKFGLDGFSQSLRLEARKHGIRVLSIFPGGIKTPFYDSLKTPVDVSGYMDPKKIAELVVYLSETEGISPDDIVINRLSK